MHTQSRPLRPGVALVAFFALTFAYSWGFWGAAAMTAAPMAGGAGSRWMVYAGIPGPFIAAIALLLFTGARDEWRDFWRRLYEVERIRPRWLWIVVLAYPLAAALAAVVDRMAGGAWPDTGRLSATLADPMLLLSTGVYALLLGPLAEEPGWRGYALDRLLAMRGPLMASVCLGLLWGLWHLPLFFIPGTYQHELGVGTQRFLLFNLTAVVLSILMTWIHQRNDRSTCAAILFHGVVNATGALVVLSDRAELIRAALLMILVFVAVRDFQQS